MTDEQLTEEARKFFAYPSRVDRKVAMSTWTVVSRLVASTVLLVVSFPVYGYVLAKLWNWFVASALGVSTLTVPSAIGITLIFNVLVVGLAAAIHDLREIRSTSKMIRLQLTTLGVVVLIGIEGAIVHVICG